MDFFNYCAIVGFIVVTGPLAAASASDPPEIRQASMAQTTILYLAGSLLWLTGLMHQMGLRTPVDFSSTKRGQVMKPGVFVLIEDVVAVDGGGLTAFRERLCKRHEASPVYRRMLAQLNWFWATGSLAVGSGTTAIVYGVDDLNVVFALGEL